MRRHFILSISEDPVPGAMHGKNMRDDISEVLMLQLSAYDPYLREFDMKVVEEIAQVENLRELAPKGGIRIDASPIDIAQALGGKQDE